MSTRQSPINPSKNQSASKTTPQQTTEAQESKSLRPSAQKNSTKSTPVAEGRDRSASRRSYTPNAAQEKAPVTPNPKAASAQKPRESSTKKNELTVPSGSKNNQASANKKSPSNFKQTTISPATNKFVAKSADKSARRSDEEILPGLNPILEDLENEANKSGLSLDLRKDLNAILDDKTADVKITATKIIKEYDVTPSKETAQSKSAAKTRSQQKPVSVSESSKKSRDKSVTRLDLEGIEVRGSNKGSEVKVEENPANGIDVEEEGGQEEQGDERSVARKEYSAYEDWRMLETVEKELAEGGKISRNFWNTVNDPLTGNRLLDGKRTSESMRDRHKRYIASLDDVGKDTLREFAKNNDLETMKKYHCIFKKVGGLKQFMGVSDQLNYNPERIQRKTPYGTKPSKKKEEEKEEQKTSTKRGGRKNVGQVERDFEEEENFEHQMEEELGEIEDDILELSDRDITFATSEVRQAPVRTKQFEVQRPSAAEQAKRKPNATSTRTIIRDDVNRRQGGRAQAPVEFIEEEDIFEFEPTEETVQEFVNIDEARKRAQKRKVPRDDDYEAVINSVAPTIHREMKKVRMPSHYEEASLHLNDVFNGRTHRKAPKNVDQDNLMVLVDLSKGFRQFVKENPEEEEREVENRKLRNLANKYKIAFNEVALIFRRVSYDYADLEEFLKRKDAKLLWTEEEDGDLLENNHTAIKYLKILKGEDRVQKRMNYLTGNL